MGSGAFAVFRRAMSCQYNLLFLFLCVFTALSVSTKECGNNLVGDSCILKLPEKFSKDDNNIQWSHSSSDTAVRRKNKKATVRTENPRFTMEDDGSLKCLNLTLEDKGDYTYTVTNPSGEQLVKNVMQINVYEKAPKPKVTFKCTSDGNATLSCEVNNREDLTVSWFKEKTPIQNPKNNQVFLLSTQVQENKAYSCEARNPVSHEQSESIKVSCPGKGFGWGTFLGFKFDWIMVSIIAGGGALLLLLACVLIICACRSCRQRSKRQLDEEELRLAVLTPGHTGTNRSKQTARGQPAPPIPLEDPKPCAPPPHTPPQTQTQPKAQNRARPPPPPQDDDEENPPPLPRPRNKQHRNKRNQEPYRPME